MERKLALDESGGYSYIYEVRSEGAFLRRLLGLAGRHRGRRMKPGVDWPMGGFMRCIKEDTF